MKKTNAEPCSTEYNVCNCVNNMLSVLFDKFMCFTPFFSGSKPRRNPTITYIH